MGLTISKAYSDQILINGKSSMITIYSDETIGIINDNGVIDYVSKRFLKDIQEIRKEKINTILNDH